MEAAWLANRRFVLVEAVGSHGIGEHWLGAGFRVNILSIRLVAILLIVVLFCILLPSGTGIPFAFIWVLRPYDALVQPFLATANERG
jgi:hypothetical protein